MKKHARILIVDDEPYNIMAFLVILKVALKNPNHQEIVNLVVDKAYDGDEAVQKVKDLH